MLTRITFGLLAWVSMVAAGSWASGQESYTLLSELYGRGVHAYFSYQYDEALGHFDLAVENGSRDPRCYYFRGMTLVRLGRGPEAQQVFQSGAALEFSSEGAYDVARSLERIQGAERLQLEGVRRQARLAAMRQPRRVRRIPDDVSTPPQTAGTSQFGSVTPASADEPATPADADPNDPFAGATMGPIGAGEIKPAVPPATEAGVAEVAAPGEEDPFGADEVMDQSPPAGTDGPVSDPFASAPNDAPAAGQGTEADPGRALQSLFKAVTGAIPGVGGSNTRDATSSEPPDPFGETTDQAADPFGGADAPADDLFNAPAPGQQPPSPPTPADAGAAPAAVEDDPFGVPTESADDLFGAPPAADTPATPPPAAAPAAAEDDPFGDLGGADADPFGAAPAGAATGDTADAAPAPAAGSESADAEVDPFADDAADDPF